MEYKVLKTSEENSIATVVINRPEAMNALNSTFFAEMKHYLKSLQGRTDLKVLIITGEGKSFAAGADIAEMVGLNAEQGKQWSIDGQKVFNMIEEAEMPVIAAINGFALGGGCELAMSCDFRIASSKARFGQPEVNLGLIPGYAGTQRLSRLTGLADALYLICSGEMITAEDALRIGLVQKVV
jgi:enoyl-CoA hydratase